MEGALDMAITASVEEKAEKALVAALKLHADLVALSAADADFVMRYGDQSISRALPKVLVRCEEVITPSHGDEGIYVAQMEIEAVTRTTDDANGDTANKAIAAVRDAFNSGANFITDLESIGGIDVRGVRRPPSRSSDTRRADSNKQHRRTLLREIIIDLINV